jgi:hypothetical protein
MLNETHIIAAFMRFQESPADEALMFGVLLVRPCKPFAKLGILPGLNGREVNNVDKHLRQPPLRLAPLINDFLCPYPVFQRKRKRNPLNRFRFDGYQDIDVTAKQPRPALGISVLDISGKFFVYIHYKSRNL